MAAKKPFVNYAGTLQELAAGDTVTGLGGTIVAYKANGTQDNIDLLDGGGITILPIAQGGTGAATGPAALVSLGAREVLTAARTYYVATTGSDSNNGLAVGTPFLTIQKAVDTVCSIDMSIYQVTIQVADGTYTVGATLRNYVGSLSPIVLGNTTTPANCSVAVASGSCFYCNTGSWIVKGFKVSASATSGNGLYTAGVSASITAHNMDFGTCGGTYGSHTRQTDGSFIKLATGYAISGGAFAHIFSESSTFYCGYVTVTLTNTPAFTGAFVYTRLVSGITVAGITWSGSATGVRYDISLNSAVFSGGTLPGDTAGTTATGGQYA